MKKKVVLLGFTLVLTVLMGLMGSIQPAYGFSEEHRLLSEVWRIVDRAYVDDSFNGQNWWFVRQRALKQSLPDRESLYAAIDDMLGSLDDPFTRFLPPEKYKSLQTSTSGELTGVGLQITQADDTGELQVIAPIEGSPAEQAGIRSRDRIFKIDGVSTRDMTLDEAADRMRGVAGSTVTLTVRHGDEAPADIPVVRDRISVNPVYSELRTQENGLNIGYIRLNQFNANATEAVSEAIAQFEAQQADAYVLDLRSNPGGLLQAGIEIARLWLDEGTIVYTVNRYGIQDSVMAFGEALTDDPLAVLVDGGTASASEILSGALQDNGRAVLIGEQTFGKGLIQSLFNLSDGSGLAVTVARYETPNHRDINRQGITPDVIIPSEPLGREQLATQSDPQYVKAVELLTQDVVIARAA